MRSLMMILMASSGFAHDHDYYAVDLSMDIIDLVNNNETTWTATVTEAVNQDIHEQRERIGTYEMGYFNAWKYGFPILRYKRKSFKKIPAEFDARVKWKQCKEVIEHVVDLGTCPLSWVWAPVSTISDRICIKSNGISKVILSYKDVLTCCTKCVRKAKNPCTDGISSEVWNFWMRDGIVTTECLYDSQRIHTNCKSKCSNSSVEYSSNKHYGKNKYKIARSVDEIQIDIMKYGPVTAQMKVFQDFLIYGEGIYQHKVGAFLGYQVVKIIGWGKVHDVPYWLCVNPMTLKSTPTFQILRGQDQCKIESETLAGHMNVRLDPREILLTTANVLKITKNLILIWTNISMVLLFNVTIYKM